MTGSDYQAIMFFLSLVMTVIGIFLTIELSVKLPGKMSVGVLLSFIFMPWGQLYAKGAAKWIILLVFFGGILGMVIGPLAFPAIMVVSAIVMALRLRKSTQSSQPFSYISTTGKRVQVGGDSNRPKEAVDYGKNTPMRSERSETDKITFKCQSCRQTIEAPRGLAGTEAECPGCGNHLTVPDIASRKLNCPHCSNMIEPPALYVGQAFECPVCNNIVRPDVSQVPIRRNAVKKTTKKRSPYRKLSEKFGEGIVRLSIVTGGIGCIIGIAIAYPNDDIILAGIIIGTATGFFTPLIVTWVIQGFSDKKKALQL